MMKTKTLIFGGFVALAGCASGGLNMDDPGVEKLFTMSTPMYYASQTIASRVAQSCPRYSYDNSLDAALNEARNEVGRGSLSANSQRRAIELETDVSSRSFAAKHGVDLASDDLCAAGDAEKLEGSAIGALLIAG